MARYKSVLTNAEFYGRDYLWNIHRELADPACKTCRGNGLLHIYMATDEEKTKTAIQLCGCLRKHLQKTDAKTEQAKFDERNRKFAADHLERITGRTEVK